MKFVFFVIACLALVICATSKKLILGHRQPGDVLAAFRKLVNKGSTGYPGQPGAIAVWRFTENIIISLVSGVNAPGSNASFDAIGGPGNNTVTVAAISPPGQGLSVHFDIYGIFNETINYSDVDDDLF